MPFCPGFLYCSIRVMGDGQMSSFRLKRLSERKYWSKGLYVSLVLFVVNMAILVMLDGIVFSQEVEIKVKKFKKKVNIKSSVGVFRSIEKAWKEQDAGEISRYAGSGRVYIDVQMLNKQGGYFSRPQVFFLFKRMFGSTKLLRFSFQRFSKPGSEGTRAYGIANRVVKDLKTGRIIKDKIYITLKWNGRGWVLSEIKSIR